MRLSLHDLLLLLLFLALFPTVILLFIRAARRFRLPPGGEPRDASDSLDILKFRLARGEINDEEYHNLKDHVLFRTRPE